MQEKYNIGKTNLNKENYSPSTRTRVARAVELSRPYSLPDIVHDLNLICTLSKFDLYMT